MSNLFLEKINTCQICNELNPVDSHYWKNHKLKQADYFEKYFPRKSLLSGKPLKFKTKENYILTDFIDKNELKDYLKSLPKEKAIEYLKDYLLRRIALKELKYACSQFELKSLIFPPISFINKQYGKNTYSRICEELGLINRYDYSQELSLDENKKLKYIIDTREQAILDLPNKKIQKLDVGDYTIEGSDIVVERKSVPDFCGTLSGGFERFNRELERCVESNKYLIILIEEPFNNINSLKILPHTKRIKATSDFIFHQARTILNKYPLNCQIVCVDNRKEAIRFIDKIFRLKNNIKTLDFQYLIDCSLF